MNINNIRVKNFRSLREINYSPVKGINLIYGDNAQGKTSLIEALRFISTGKSFLTSALKDLIYFEENTFFIKTLFAKNNLNQSLSIGLNRDMRKVYTLNQSPLPSLSRLIGNLDTVLLTPYDLDIVNGSPEVKRKFLDIMLCQAMPEYLQEIKIYNRVLKQRNSLLKKNNPIEKVIRPWTDELIRSGTFIIQERKKAIKQISDLANKFLNSITAEKEKLVSKYSTIKHNNNNIHDAFRDQLKESREQEKYFKYTLCGPHRDNINFYINNLSLKKFGSRGQNKSVALSLKYAEINILSERKGYQPVILIDDIMHELDEQRREKLWLYLGSLPQVFITATSKDKTLLDKLKIDVNEQKISGGSLA